MPFPNNALCPFEQFQWFCDVGDDYVDADDDSRTVVAMVQ